MGCDGVSGAKGGGDQSVGRVGHIIMTPVSEIRANALAKLGTLERRVGYPAQTLDWLKDRVPNSVVDILATLGLGTWRKGKWQTVDALRYDGLLRQTLQGDPDFAPEDCTALAIRGFGDLECWHRVHGALVFNVFHNELSASGYFEPSGLDAERAALISFSCTSLVVGDYYDHYDRAYQPLFERLIAAHGPLSPGQIFAPRLHPALGGGMELDNFRPAAAAEAVALIHQMEPYVLIDHSAPRKVKVRHLGPQ